MSEENKIKLDLQKFSEVSTPTPPDPNTNTTGSSGLSNENKTYYHDTLIDNAEPYLVHDQFGTEINIPEHGGKTVEVRYFDVLAKNTTALTEGVTPDGSSLSMGVKNVTLAQYGDYVTLSDVVSVTTIDPMLVQATKAMGSQAGRSLDTITRNVITAGTNVLYCPKTVAGVLTPVTSRDDLDETSLLTPDIFLQAQAMLEANLAEPVEGGSYVAIIHPYAAYDIMSSPQFVEWHKYAAPEQLFRGEIGMIGNIRFVKSTEARIVRNTVSTTAGGVTTSTTSTIFLTMVLGKDAYATTYARGLGLEHIVKPLGAGEDPLNQRCTAGWKAMKAALRLKEQNMIRIESMSTFSSKVTAAN